MLYREYPEKSFKSFSLLANALPIGIPAEGLDLGILQPEIGILQPDWYSSDSWHPGIGAGTALYIGPGACPAVCPELPL